MKSAFEDLACLIGSGTKPDSRRVSTLADPLDITVPVMVGGALLATLSSGRVLRRPPSERGFLNWIAQLKAERKGNWEGELRRIYFETPVVTEHQFQSMVSLLKDFAQHLADCTDRLSIAAVPEEPEAISNAKRFVQIHFEEPITSKQAALHVHVSRFHFCKLFKKATGVTFSEYVSRVRLDEAKRHLAQPAMRVSEAAFAAGFGSIPRFNSVFKRRVGMSPTQYRGMLRARANPPVHLALLPVVQDGFSSGSAISEQQKPMGK